MARANHLDGPPVWPGCLAEHTGLRDRLLAAYVDPGRAYHDARHLLEVCNNVAALLEAGEPGDRDTTLLAVWFHDAVYDDGCDLEERSAQLAERELDRVGLPPRTVAEVARLVRLTETHHPADGDRNGQLLCDADLAVLGAEPERYADYVAGVRQEHPGLTDEQFAAGRAAVLRDLLARPTLFHTAEGRRRWDSRARHNLRAELDRVMRTGPRSG